MGRISKWEVVEDTYQAFVYNLQKMFVDIL